MKKFDSAGFRLFAWLIWLNLSHFIWSRTLRTPSMTIKSTTLTPWQNKQFISLLAFRDSSNNGNVSLYSNQKRPFATYASWTTLVEAEYSYCTIVVFHRSRIVTPWNVYYHQPWIKRSISTNPPSCTNLCSFLKASASVLQKDGCIKGWWNIYESGC